MCYNSYEKNKEVIIINVGKYFISGICFLVISVFNIIKWFFIGLLTSILIFPYYFGLGIYYLSSKERRNNIGFTKPVIPTIMMTLSLATYFISIFLLTRWFVQSKRIEKMSEGIVSSTVILESEEADISDYEDEDENVLENNSNNLDDYSDSYYLNVDFDSLLNRNSDTVAWLKVYGTNINYPVVQSDDNEYYLNHDINKYTTNVGWIFGDYRSNFDTLEKNTIIYGHNLINKTMFGSLPKILNSSWYKNKNNHYIKMNTVNNKMVFKVFSVYKIDPVVDYLRTSFSSDDEYENWLNTLKNRSIYNFNESVSSEDKILTLSTCDDSGNKRVVLHAKLISIQ